MQSERRILKSNLSFLKLIKVACRMAACFFTQPLDLVKNRMQVSGEYI